MRAVDQPAARIEAGHFTHPLCAKHQGAYEAIRFANQRAHAVRLEAKTIDADAVDTLAHVGDHASARRDDPRKWRRLKPDRRADVGSAQGGGQRVFGKRAARRGQLSVDGKAREQGIEQRFRWIRSAIAKRPLAGADGEKIQNRRAGAGRQCARTIDRRNVFGGRPALRAAHRNRLPLEDQRIAVAEHRMRLRACA